MAKQSNDDLRVVSISAWQIRGEASRGARRTAAAADPFIVRLEQTQRVTVAGAYEAQLPARRGVEDQPLVLEISPKKSGSYVVLARHASGAVTFSVPEPVVGRRGTARAGATRYRFQIVTQGSSAAGGRRGIGGKIVRFFVLRFVNRVANLAIEKLARRWEERSWTAKKLPRGLCRVEATAGGQLSLKPVTNPRQIEEQRKLLLIHGTFSNTEGGFEGLAKTAGSDGQTFLQAVHNLYGDRIYAFNHFTVSKTPLENAQELLSSLPNRVCEFDVVTHSRGALVLRTLVERRSDLGRDSHHFHLGSAVVAAGPNEGTPLASPERWKLLTDWLGNVIDLFPDNPFTFGIEFILEAVAWLAEKVGNVIPGLAAMNPAGREIADLQESPGPEGRLSALVANFEPDANVLLRMVDVGVDVFFGGANDLVVPTEGGWRIDKGATPAISGENIGCFGPGGNLGADHKGTVHHCNLFSRPETIDFLVQSLRGEPHPILPMDPARDLPAARLGRRRGGEIKPAPQPRQPSAAPVDAVPVPDSAPILRSLVSPYALDEILNLFVLVPDIALQEADELEGLSADQSSRDEFNPGDLANRIAVSTRQTTALMIASFRNARVSVPFRTKSGAAGRRFQKLIATHRRIKGYVNGESQFENLPSDGELRNFGALLFSTLFPGEVRRLYDAARAELRRDRHLDVCLTSTIGWVADMPWEFAFDPSRQMYLCMEEVNFLRNIATAVPADTIGARPSPLRILVVAAQPIGAGALSIAEEEDVIRRGFAPLEQAGLAKVTVVGNVTPGRLHEILSQADVRQQQYDVLHFIGHGEFDDATGFGFLLFEDADGRSYRLRADYFRQIVARRGIRLVFLNACETGMGFKSENRFDFAQGAAPMLVAGGVPAVIANQFKVLDPSAMAFAQHFYWALAIGRTIGDAAREARVAVNYSIAGEAIDWAVPILFARNPGDRITQPAGEIRGQLPESKDSPAKSAQRRSIHTSHKRVAIWDVNYAVPQIDAIIKRLNELQSYFAFERIEMPAPIGMWRSVQHGSQHSGFVSAVDVADKLEEARQRLNVHQLFCITSLPLSLTGADDELTLYVPDDTQVCIMSMCKTLDRFQPPLLTVERLIANQLAFSLSNLEYAHERGKKDCPGYFNDEIDVQFLAGPLAFCSDCLEQLNKAEKPHRDALIALTRAYPLYP